MVGSNLRFRLTNYASDDDLHEKEPHGSSSRFEFVNRRSRVNLGIKYSKMMKLSRRTKRNLLSCASA